MRIRTHMGVSVDGYVATPDGRPTLLSAPGFVPGVSHGHPEFIAGCEAVLMGRTTLDPALAAGYWPWGEMPAYVLTSRPLPPEAPAQVRAAADPAELLARMRREVGGDVHLVGGPSTIAAFAALGALDRLEVVVLPVVLGAGRPLLPDGTPQYRLRLEGSRPVGDDAIELAYGFSPAP